MHARNKQANAMNKQADTTNKLTNVTSKQAKEKTEAAGKEITKTNAGKNCRKSLQTR